MPLERSLYDLQVWHIRAVHMLVFVRVLEDEYTWGRIIAAIELDARIFWEMHGCARGTWVDWGWLECQWEVMLEKAVRKCRED